MAASASGLRFRGGLKLLTESYRNRTPNDSKCRVPKRNLGFESHPLRQKCFTVDFLTKKRKVNEGEVPQYYVEHSHEPIITPEEFDKVQTELARRKQISRQYSGKSIFPPELSVVIAVHTSAQKSGTPPQNTAGSSGNATANLRVSTNVRCHTWTRKPSKHGSWQPLTLSSKAKTTSLRIAD